MESSPENIRKRVCKACDRCRLKKSKCDGSSPCSRCQQDNAICVFGERKKSQDKVYPKGYVEILEQQQTQLVLALRELYFKLVDKQPWPGERLRLGAQGGQYPLTHDILDRLNLLHLPSDSGATITGNEGSFEDNPKEIERRLWDQGAQGATGSASRVFEDNPRVSGTGIIDTLATGSATEMCEDPATEMFTVNHIERRHLGEQGAQAMGSANRRTSTTPGPEDRKASSGSSSSEALRGRRDQYVGFSSCGKPPPSPPLSAEPSSGTGSLVPEAPSTFEDYNTFNADVTPQWAPLSYSFFHPPPFTDDPLWPQHQSMNDPTSEGKPIFHHMPAHDPYIPDNIIDIPPHELHHWIDPAHLHGPDSHTYFPIPT